MASAVVGQEEDVEEEADEKTEKAADKGQRRRKAFCTEVGKSMCIKS